MKIGDWTPACISPMEGHQLSVETIRAQRMAELRDIVANRQRHNADYEVWSSAPIPHDPEWDDPKWTDDNPMPPEMAKRAALYAKQQGFIAAKVFQQKAADENKAKMTKLGPIIPNPEYDPTKAVKLLGIKVTPIFKPAPEPEKLTLYQRFKRWLGH